MKDTSHAIEMKSDFSSWIVAQCYVLSAEVSEEIEYVVIENNADLRTMIGDRRHALDSIRSLDRDVIAIQYSDSAPRFLSHQLPVALTSRVHSDEFLSRGWYVTVEDHDLSSCQRPVNGALIELLETGVRWIAYPRHADHQIATMELPYWLFRQTEALPQRRAG